MKESSVEQLLEHAIHVQPGMGDLWPAQKPGSMDRIGRIDMGQEISRFGGGKAYSVANSCTIGLILDKEYYVIPATTPRIRMLKSAKWQRKTFYVPFSFGDIPSQFKDEWQALMEDAAKENYSNFSVACEETCKARGIRNLGQISLAKCLMIPDEGMDVLKPYFADTVREYGVFTDADRKKIVDERIKSLLGKFTEFNEVIVFTTINGDSYLAKGSAIREELLEAGYEETDDLFVPLANGGKIIGNDALAQKWAELPVFD